MTAYAVALALTLLIEVPIYGAGLTRLGALPFRRAITIGVLVNLVSHPLAFLGVFPLLRHPLGDVAALIVVELAVMLGEAWGVWWLGGRARAIASTAMITAAMANTVSLALGLAMV